MFRNKQDKTEYSDLPEHPRQMLEILAKLDEIDRKLGAWADNVKRFDQKLATVIEQRNQSVKATTIGVQWAREIERKLDVVLKQRSQPVQPVGKATDQCVKNVYLDEVTPDAEPDKLDTLLYARDGKLKRVYYNTDPVGYIERKIYNATASHKTATCIFLSALRSAVNTPATNRRKHITAAKLVEHLLELLSDKRIIAVKAKPRKTKVPSGDIGFQLASSETPVLDRYSVLSDEEATEILNLFARWNNG